MKDIVIIGAGPAGVTAAIYGKRAGFNIEVIESAGVGGQILSTYEVDNYPALKGISGIDLGTKMKDHAIELGVSFTVDTVKSVEADGGNFKVITENGQYDTKNVIIATGATHRNLGAPGEKELTGMGVSYCATCDGAFYKGSDVAVIGGGDVALEDAIFLARTCNKVYLIHRRDEFRGAKVLQDAVFNTENIEVIFDTTVASINGADEDEVTGLTLHNVKTGEESELALEGVFIAVGTIPCTDFVKNLVSMDPNGYIVAGEDCRSSVKGVYVAGDCRTKALRQVVTAVADGANAVKSIETDYLNM